MAYFGGHKGKQMNNFDYFGLKAECFGPNGAAIKSSQFEIRMSDHQMSATGP